tara:strand:+ start:1558 stop:2757 length:1200 start_codon:yes stop_codon:yes gene_type:complete
MNFVIFSLIYLSILRVLYIPLFGDLSVIVSGAVSVIFGLILLFKFKVDNSTLFIIPYSFLLFFISIFQKYESFFDIFISFFETLTPFIVIGVISSSNFKRYFNKNIVFFKKGIIFLILILLLGHALNLLGFPLGDLGNVALVSDLQDKFFTNTRVSSFVGTSGPYSLCISFLLISLQILYPKFLPTIFLFGTLILLLSFSRLGLATFIIFNFTKFIQYSIGIFTRQNLKIRKNSFFYLVFAISLIFIIINLYYESISLLYTRFMDGFDFVNDAGNVDRISRFKQLVFEIKEDNFINILIGDGTGRTSRFLQAYQGESQLGKIYVEWGLIGLSLAIFWLLDISNILKLKGNQIILDINTYSFPIFFSLIFSLLFIQSFTSAPVFISMIFPIMTMNYRFIK